MDAGMIKFQLHKCITTLDSHIKCSLGPQSSLRAIVDQESLSLSKGCDEWNTDEQSQNAYLFLVINAISTFEENYGTVCNVA
jgi:hypothetical protein